MLNLGSSKARRKKASPCADGPAASHMPRPKRLRTVLKRTILGVVLREVQRKLAAHTGQICGLGWRRWWRRSAGQGAGRAADMDGARLAHPLPVAQRQEQALSPACPRGGAHVQGARRATPANSASRSVWRKGASMPTPGRAEHSQGQVQSAQCARQSPV